MNFSEINEAIEDLKNGKMIIVVDDEGRENEGDLVIPAEAVTGESINFMIKYAKGLVCVPIEEEIAEDVFAKTIAAVSAEASDPPEINPNEPKNSRAAPTAEKVKLKESLCSFPNFHPKK